MKILLAPDKFKGNMSSPEVCEILHQAFSAEFPGAEIVMLPMADGGEGTVDAVVAAKHGTLRYCEVTGPLGRKVTAQYGLFDHGRSAVMEMSSASGLALLSPAELQPLKASTYGTGELIRAAMDAGVRSITLGIGGSATTDGGSGMAQALGFRLLDAAGKELTAGPEALLRLDSIDCTHADPRLKETEIRVACDVTNPLLGENGSAAVYAPQKGATPEQVVILEKALTILGNVWLKQGMLTSLENPGDGAAGGLGAGLRAFCHGVPVSGAKLIMSLHNMEEQLKGTSLLITGEGCTDSQTSSGKICGELAKCAKAAGVPVMLLSGALKGDGDFNELFDYAFSTSTGAHASIGEAVRAGKKDLAFTARNLAKLLHGGLLQ